MLVKWKVRSVKDEKRMKKSRMEMGSRTSRNMIEVKRKNNTENKATKRDIKKTKKKLQIKTK